MRFVRFVRERTLNELFQFLRNFFNFILAFVVVGAYPLIDLFYGGLPVPHGGCP